MFRTKVAEKIKTHILHLITFFKKKSSRLRDNLEKYCAVGQDWHMRLECWIPKATNIHSEYVIPIGFTLEQMLHELTSLIRYSYIA